MNTTDIDRDVMFRIGLALNRVNGLLKVKAEMEPNLDIKKNLEKACEEADEAFDLLLETMGKD